jgi:RNA polymerase sigma factor (TIGR02999 family)
MLYNRCLMDATPKPDVTGLLGAWRSGDPLALEQLMSVIHEELRRTARHYMQLERPGHTLQTTALVNEAFLRIAGVNQVEYRDRVHFFALAAQMMRRVLVDHARSRGYLKRGAGARPVALDESRIASPERDGQVLALDDALDELTKQDPRKARVVELRFFAGLSVEETAVALDVSPQTVLRDWSLSKAWLARRMSHAGTS